MRHRKMIGTRIAIVAFLLFSACGEPAVELVGAPWPADSADAGGGGDYVDVGSEVAVEDAGATANATDAALVEAGDEDAASAVPDVDATPVDETPTNAAEQAVITAATVNIGRDYRDRAEVSSAIADVHDRLVTFAGPAFIGWQEIGGGDPCGTCEIEIINNRFAADQEWDTRRPRGTRPNGGSELVGVPVTTRRADNLRVRTRFASPAWAGISRTRFVTVVYSPQRNVSTINTHLIAGAWSCKSQVAMRKEYWRRGWLALKEEVAREHDRGRNVVVTGDLNRPRSANNCNPAWNPTSLHPDAKIVGGGGIDYIFAVPAPGQKFKVDRRADGSARRGSIALGIDSHKAHWVRGRFTPID